MATAQITPFDPGSNGRSGQAHTTAQQVDRVIEQGHGLVEAFQFQAKLTILPSRVLGSGIVPRLQRHNHEILGRLLMFQDAVRDLSQRDLTDLHAGLGASTSYRIRTLFTNMATWARGAQIKHSTLEARSNSLRIRVQHLRLLQIDVPIWETIIALRADIRRLTNRLLAVDTL
jgi:hypothetical protein